MLAWALSENRRAFPLRTAGLELAVPVPLALLLIKRAGPSSRRIGSRRRSAPAGRRARPQNNQRSTATVTALECEVALHVK